MTELNDQQLQNVTGGTASPNVDNGCINQCLRSKNINPDNATDIQIRDCEQQCPNATVRTRPVYQL